MPTALFLSPHLDDVAFSCGGTLWRLANGGWKTVLCTVFTASAPEPRGFALRCQTDKGIPPETDYMALRRAEDHAFAAASKVAEIRHWPFREAPHRGYESPADLFAGIHPGDDAWRPVRDELARLDQAIRPDLIFAPQGLGNHADHLQVIRAALEIYPVGRVAWYRDTPYAIRAAAAAPAPLLSAPDLLLVRVALSTEELAHKIGGCAMYASQVGFQFGGTSGIETSLTAFHRSESGPGPRAGFAERFLVHPDLYYHLPA